MSHIIAIEIGEAVGTVRETIRRQLDTMVAHVGRPIALCARPTIGPETIWVELTAEECERVLDTIARNVVQAIYALEVPG